MRFEFFPIPSDDPTDPDGPVLLDVPAAALAAGIVLDWLPGAHNWVQDGFAAVLSQIVTIEGLGGQDRWIAKEIGHRLERQWKAATSWMVGIAFAHRIFEHYGYAWRAPVSAFSALRPNDEPYAPYWRHGTHPGRCEITRLGVSRLLPDYVLLREPEAGGSFELSFAEVKGTADRLSGLTTAPPAWANQSRNAVFTTGEGLVVPPRQQIVVATRYCPNAKRSRTRCVCVRAWNAADEVPPVPPEVARTLLVAHYYGLCKRLGLDHVAELLATSQEADSEQDAEAAPRRRRRRPRDRARMRDEAYAQLDSGGTLQLPEYPDLPLRTFGSPRRVGTHSLRLGLSRDTINMIVALADGSTAVESLEGTRQSIARARDKALHEARVVLRADGVVAALE